jgi:hypothetical protein
VNKGASPEETQHCTLHFAQAGQQGGGSRFNVARYFGGLEAAVLGRLVLAAEAITSTQTIIQDNVVALPDGTLCVADKQIGGKGGLKGNGLSWRLRFFACQLTPGRHKWQYQLSLQLPRPLW